MDDNTVGRTGFVRLGQDSEPRWREALALGVDEGWVHLLVRAVSTREIPKGMSRVEIAGKSFFLLGVPQNRFLGSCGSQQCLALEAELKELLEIGQTKLAASDSDLHFLSAGESPRGEPRRKQSRSRGSQQLQEASSSSESGGASESSEDQEMKQTLAKLQKNWLGEATSSGDKGGKPKKEKKKGRHSLLATSRKKEPNDAQVSIGQLALKSLEEEKDPLRALLTVQLMKDLHKHRHRSRSSSRKRSVSSNSSQSSSRSSGKPTRKSKRKMRRRPLKYVKRYVRSVEKELGAEDRPFRVSEMGRKINWGKQKTLQRVHFMMSETLELMLKQKWERAALQLVLNLKALHQTALDGGDWSVGWLLSHLPDPFNKQRFGGDAEELSHVTAYLKSMAELERNTERLRATMPWNSQTSQGEGSEKESKKYKKKGKGKGAKPDEEKTES